MADALTLTEISHSLDTLANIMVRDGIGELAGHGASFWRDAAFELRRFAEEPPERTDSKPPPMDLKAVFEKCRSAIGGDSNEDIRWYVNERPKTISRNSYFEHATWAIWVAGMGRKGTRSFLTKARQAGFRWNFATVGAWDDRHLEQFMEKLHGRPVPDRARGKWESIHHIARELSRYRNDEDFCGSFFAGKTESKDLDDTDALGLAGRKIPFIGKASAQLIIRNMGGELIKYDRWMIAFLGYFRISPRGLESQLQKLGIPYGLFDIVIWAYCEKNIRTVDQFDQHFDRHIQNAVKG